MFAQLGIWLGIRMMLGDPMFNRLFGNGPIYLTQQNYEPIRDPHSPERGNPLFPFMRPPKDTLANPVCVSYIPNADTYPYKHPAGNSNGHNCLVVNGEYGIFSQCLPETPSPWVAAPFVQNLLVLEYNLPPTDCDAQRLEAYSAKDPQERHPILGFEYATLIALADMFKGEEIATTGDAKREASVQFDLPTFKTWVTKMTQDHLSEVHPTLLPTAAIANAPISGGALPFENSNMNFETFKAKMTDSQTEFLRTGQWFCQGVMDGKSTQVVLTGEAGVGKTAIAVCCARALAASQKSVVWLSEAMVAGWATEATSSEELNQCRTKIRQWLTPSADVVILDDNNIAGWAGKIVFEEVFDWFASTPGRGLFITSNVPINVAKLYGHRLDQTYVPAPFPGYDSPQYMRAVVKTDLKGTSLRTSAFQYASLPKNDVALLQYLAGLDLANVRSAGVIVSQNAFLEVQATFGTDLLTVPGIPYPVMAEIRMAYLSSQPVGPFLDLLTQTQKNLLRTFKVEELHSYSNGKSTVCPSYFGVAVTRFSRTDKQIIAVELLEILNIANYPHSPEITRDCLDQLMAIIHFAHDQGGRRVVIVNLTTTFTQETLFDQIIRQLPEQDAARTSDRLRVLLGRPPLSPLP